MSVPSIRELLEIPSSELPDEAPTNDDGRLVCGRVCANGGQCSYVVLIPWMSCHCHGLHDPVAIDDTDSSVSSGSNPARTDN